jgi:type I restriction enzyme S subunit
LKFKLLADRGKVFASGPFGSSIGSQFYREEGVPVIRGNNLSIDGNKPYFTDNGYVFLSNKKADELSNAEVRHGDLIFTARGTVGQVGLVPNDGSITWTRAILSANQLRFRNKRGDINPLFLWYLFSSWLVRTQISLSSDSVAQPNLNLGSLKGLDILLPDFYEQTQIANFLDHETAKIDVLIDKQQHLIALLKEKRQAVISHAVTKGLNPDAPMKDSGVEWLGKVPEHWEVSQIKYKVQVGTSIMYGIVQAGPHVDDGIPYIKTSDMAGDALPIDGYSKTSKEIDEAYRRSKVSEGDIVVAIRATVGKCLPVPKELEGANLTQGTAKISPGAGVDGEFLLLYSTFPVELSYRI